MCLLGTSDPYVKFRHNQFKYRSPVVYRSLNPVWNRNFGFVSKDLRTPVLVRVFDHDFGSSDDFMGQGYIDLSQYAPNQLSIGAQFLTLLPTDNPFLQLLFPDCMLPYFSVSLLPFECLLYLIPFTRLFPLPLGSQRPSVFLSFSCRIRV